MSLAYGMEQVAGPITRLPPINRSPPIDQSQSPSFFGSMKMKDLVPLPLKKRYTTTLKRSGEVYRSQPILIDRSDAPSAESLAPPRFDEPRITRSVSPAPRSQSPSLRVDHPRQARSVSPAPNREPRSSRVRTSPRYYHVPPQYLKLEPASHTLNTSTQIRSYTPYSPPPIPSQNQQQLRKTRGQEPQPVHSSLPRQYPIPTLQELPAEVGEHVKTSRHTSREAIPSMIEYLSLEQLESLWRAQDLYKGTVDLPQKIGSPMWRLGDGDPRSPIHPAFRSELDETSFLESPNSPVHPLFRQKIYSYHNSFAQSAR